MKCEKCKMEIQQDQGIWIKFGSDRGPRIYLCKNCAGLEFLDKTFRGQVLSVRVGKDNKPILKWMDMLFPNMKQQEKKHGACVINAEFVENQFWADLIIPVENFLNKRVISDISKFNQSIKNLCFCMWQFANYHPLEEIIMLGFNLLPYLIEILTHPEMFDYDERASLLHSVGNLIEKDPKSVKALKFDIVTVMISSKDSHVKELGFKAFRTMIETQEGDPNTDTANTAFQFIFEMEDALKFSAKSVFNSIGERYPQLTDQIIQQFKQTLFHEIENALIAHNDGDHLSALLKRLCVYMHEFYDQELLQQFVEKKINVFPALADFILKKDNIEASRGFDILGFIIKTAPESITQTIIDAIVEEFHPDSRAYGFALLAYMDAIKYTPHLINKTGLEKILNFINQKDRYVSVFERGQALRTYGFAAYYTPDLITPEGIRTVKERLSDNDKEVAQGARDAYRNIGVMYSKKGEYRQALDCFKTLLQYEPNNAHFLNGLAWNLYLNAQYEESRDIAEKAVKIDSSKSYIWDTLACALFGMKEYSKSWAAFKKMKEIDPTHVGTEDVYNKVKKIIEEK